MEKPRKIVSAGYDRITEIYARERDLFDNREMLKKFSDFLPDHAEVLDLGCGSALPVGKHLVECGYTYTGVDISSSMLKLARENLPDSKFFLMDITELDFEPESFDGVTAFYSIFHVKRNLHDRLFTSLHTILKPGGCILFSLDNSDWEGVEDFHGVPMFWSHYEPFYYMDLMNRLEFEIEYQQEIEQNGETHFWIIARKKQLLLVDF